MTTCKTCRTIRARLVLWLGKALGVMEDPKQPQRKVTQMEMTLDQLMSIIGNKEVEIIGLRMQLAQAQQKINEMEAPELKLKAVE